MKILSTILMLSTALVGFSQVSITFTVNMANVATAPSGVYIAGGGNFGNPGDNPMFDDGTNGDAVAADDVWTIVAVKPTGFAGNYTFTNGNCPGYECKENIVGLPCADGPFSDRVTVPINSDTTIQACFSQCTTDGSCAAPTFGDVTFQVDMNNYAVAITTVSVGGTWNGFDPFTSTVLTETPAASGIYVGTVNLQDGAYSYKFIADAGLPGQDYEELVPGPCVISEGGFSNRGLTVAGDATLPLVCYTTCEACMDPVEMIDITFNVNMANETVDPSGVYIAGGATFGAPGANQMIETAPGSGVYSITLAKPVGFSDFYTFTNGACADFSCKENIAGLPCANPGNFNDRFVGPVAADTTLSTCFSQCSTDGTCEAPPVPYDITFSVDMNQYAGPEIITDSSVYVFGTFNGFNSSQYLLDDSDADGVYEITISILEGSYEFLYVLNNGAATEFFGTDSVCTVGPPFNNRILLVTADEALPTVCYESCSACVTGPDCSVFDTAPVDLTKSFDPVNDLQDRVQVKWFKDSPEVRYSDEDAAACDINFWAKRNLDPVTGSPVGPAIVNPDTVFIKNAKKFFADNVTPREIFKWPVKFRAAADAPNAKRADANIRYEWKVRCACEHGAGQESPWSAVKIFNTPDFDPITGIYTAPGGASENSSKTLMNSMDISLYPNPSDGEALMLVLGEDNVGTVDVRVMSISGAIIHRQTENVKGSQIQLDFDQVLPSGMYFVQVEMNGAVSNERFIVR